MSVARPCGFSPLSLVGSLRSGVWRVANLWKRRLHGLDRKRRFQNAVLGCVHLRKNFRNGVPVLSVTEIPLLLLILDLALDGG